MALWSPCANLGRASKHRTYLRLESLDGRSIPATGGGFTAGGIVGEYFNNSELAGEPAFTRRDVRVDFDWQDRSPGGSNSPNYLEVGAEDFSVRWTGQIVPRFSQSYTFSVTGDDGARLWVGTADEVLDWHLLVDEWDIGTLEPVNAQFSMVAGRRYDLRFDYRNIEGPAATRLSWSSQSTPAEVIESATNLGVNAVTYDHYLYADAAKAGRPGWGDPLDYFGGEPVPTDAFGWPLADAGHLFWESMSPDKTGGTYRLQFTGQAEVTGWMGRGEFRVDGIEYGNTLPIGVGYNSETNVTSAEVVLTGTDLFGLNFTQTQRDIESEVGSGIADVQLMRPIAPDSDISYVPGQLFDADLKQAFSRYTTLRYLTANFNPEKEWADRKLPGAMIADWADRAAVWEYEVMLANETGKDLYITLPVGASAEYIQNLALLLRYGSDGEAPYAETPEAAVYPPLNPNLRVYVEWGNEFWNWAFSQGGWAADAGRAAVLANTAEGRIINFDGQRPDGDFRRWAALRTVEASNLFREVWGDAAMGDKVRVLLEYQYDNQQATAVETLKFIDRYYNNGDGIDHVADSHPVSYYLWGAGGAAYFGASNPRGLQNTIRIPGATFDGIVAGPGGTATKVPKGSSWRFEGDAGIYRDLAGVAANTPMVIPGVGKVPATPNSRQAMYISGAGSVSVTINFTRPGVYAIDFLAASELGPDLGNLLDFYLGDQRITPNGRELEASPYPWWPGNGHRDASKFSTYGTVPVEIGLPGKYTLRIVGRGTADRTTVIDDLRVASLDAIFNSRIPTGVHAAGETSALDLRTHLMSQANFALAYGLNVVAYEGGWSLGGDGAAVPLQSWAKYHDLRTASIMAKSIDAFYQASGEVYVLGVYDQWYLNDAAHAENYPIVQGIDARLLTLPAPPTAKLVVKNLAPVTLRSANGLRSLSAISKAAPGDWVMWNVTISQSANYRVTAKADPDGWTAVSVDGDEIGRGSSGLAPGGIVRLEAGVHTIRVQSLGGLYVIRGLTLDGIENMLVP